MPRNKTLFGPYHPSRMVQEAKSDWSTWRDLNLLEAGIILAFAVLIAFALVWSA